MVDQDKKPRGITAIAVSGFKSLRDETRIAIRPLTVLAGANSSGKSSIMQPLLLLKQTLESPYDAGPLKLNGPNVNFTEAEQFFATQNSSGSSTFTFAIVLDELSIKNKYRLAKGKPKLELYQTVYQYGEVKQSIRLDMKEKEISSQFNNQFPYISNWADCQIFRERAFLTIQHPQLTERRLNIALVPNELDEKLVQILHIPGLRRFSNRSYPFAFASNNRFVGTFENYFAGEILGWEEEGDQKLSRLYQQLLDLKLTSRVSASIETETQIKLSVGRTISSDATDTVNIADVGFGVSQVLPVLVALLVAAPGQLVYIEQPELHLHPRAQVALAQVLVDAANRGVRVVIETHSDLVLLGIQTLVAENVLKPEDVIFHWFRRDEEGVSRISSTELDELGGYVEDFPEDFAEVDFRADSRYLDAIEKRRMGEA
jgi:AAA15 family ATPase/GTPase